MRDTLYFKWTDPHVFGNAELTDEEWERLDQLNIGMTLRLKVDLSSGHVEVEP